MSNSIQEIDNILSCIADSINAKGVQGKMTAAEMPQKIMQIQSGISELEPLTIGSGANNVKYDGLSAISVDYGFGLNVSKISGSKLSVSVSDNYYTKSETSSAVQISTRFNTLSTAAQVNTAIQAVDSKFGTVALTGYKESLFQGEDEEGNTFNFYMLIKEQ